MVRKHGRKPYTYIVVHGGPGDIGSLFQMAEVLSAYTGTLEPLQSKYSVSELLDELHGQITGHAALPAVLVGHSWGAWLAALYASRYPDDTKTLILVGAGAFEQEENIDFVNTRMGRLTSQEQQEYRTILGQLGGEQNKRTDGLMMRLGELSEKADTYCPVPYSTQEQSFDGAMFQKVWGEAAEMRRTGKLLDGISGIKCPVYVIHGAYDPHPVDGVVNPLKKAGINPNVIIYDKCGHSPFKEKYAHDAFYEFLRSTVPEP